MFSKGINLPDSTLSSAMEKIINPEKNEHFKFKEALKNSSTYKEPAEIKEDEHYKVSSIIYNTISLMNMMLMIGVFLT